MAKRSVPARWPVCIAMCAALAIFAPAGAARADVTLSTSTAPDGGIAARLGGLMGLEQASLATVSETRLRRIGAPFRGRGDDPRILSEAALDRLRAPRGGPEWQCLTEALYFEARGEPIEGQYAVAEVILNRVDHPVFPDTICGVVNEGTGRRHACQFSYTCDGRPEEVADTGAWHRLGHIARIMMEGAPRDLTNGATHYHADWVAPRWSSVYPQTAEYGVHVFYRRQY